MLGPVSKPSSEDGHLDTAFTPCHALQIRLSCVAVLVRHCKSFGRLMAWRQCTSCTSLLFTDWLGACPCSSRHHSARSLNCQTAHPICFSHRCCQGPSLECVHSFKEHVPHSSRVSVKSNKLINPEQESASTLHSRGKEHHHMSH